MIWSLLARIGIVDRPMRLSRSGMTIDCRVFQHEGNEGFRVEERLLLREQKRFLGSRQEDDFTDCVGQDPTSYLPRPNYRPHRFQPSIDRHYLVGLPVEEWCNTAKSRLESRVVASEFRRRRATGRRP